MRYEVKSVASDYGVYLGDNLIVIMNGYYYALQVCELLNVDKNIKIYSEVIK